MTSDLAWMLIRYALIAGFTWLSSRGYVTEEQVQTVIGALGAIFTVGWGAYVRTGTKTVSASIGSRSDVPTVSAATGSIER